MAGAKFLNGLDACQMAESTATEETHQDGFSLVICMVGCNQGSITLVPHHFFKKTISKIAGFFFRKCFILVGCHKNCQPLLLGKIPQICLFLIRFPTLLMVDMGDSNVKLQTFFCSQKAFQQGHGIIAARDGH